MMNVSHDCGNTYCSKDTDDCEDCLDPENILHALLTSAIARIVTAYN